MVTSRVQKLNPLQQAVLSDLGVSYLNKRGASGLTVWGFIQRKTVMIRLGVMTFESCVKVLREYRATYETKVKELAAYTDEDTKIEREQYQRIVNALDIAVGDILMVKTIGATEQEAMYTVYIQYATVDHERILMAIKALIPDYDRIEASHFSDESGMSSATFNVKDRAIYDEIELLYAQGAITYAQLSMGRAKYMQDGSC